MSRQATVSSVDLLFFSCLAAFLLALYFSGSFLFRTMEAYSCEKKVSRIEASILELDSLSQAKQKAEHAALKSDPSSIKNSFEMLPLLNLERCSLELLKKKQALSELENRRLNFIINENFFHFLPGKKIENGSYCELEEKLQHAIQIDDEDLQMILFKLESPPQIRVKKFFLEREGDAPHYTLYLELWRKEKS